MNDAVTITRDLVRCPSVTPADAGALGVLERLLKDAERASIGGGNRGAADEVAGNGNGVIHTPA